MIWVTSDTELGHTNIIRYCNRPFNSVGEMDEKIVEQFNSLMGKNDILYHLGDLGRGNLSALRGKFKVGTFHLILGNHDHIKNWERPYFDSISHYKEIKHNGHNIVLSHYAMRVWNKSHHGAIQLHGHSHGTLPNLGNRQDDMGWDVWKRPLPLDEVVELLSKRPIHVIDHHNKRTNK